MNTNLTKTIQNLKVSSIPKERTVLLNSFAQLLQSKKDEQKNINLNFICTHNSRRSHLSQIWMQTLANFFNLDKVFCYSGGTESTAIASPIIKTLKDQGFNIQTISQGKNPIHAIKYDSNTAPIIGFSKEYFSDFNPKSNFIAIMTCSQADEGCPLVLGTDNKIPLTFEDPKAFDNTPLQDEKYLERSTQIATELYYVLSQIK
ncbi:arsenate reductase [Tenacibaculum sp. MAR_2009_124]|uniref:arsenate-mycothiol transferase ArsC n=1 Tax=Tenacibaculum sp. MAR_2009_124 TaxID=1250059 RepID=UPI000894EC6A|nr:protein-tyrosine-phosphatase [Tenacibaculum sp. MAR_2009_124]SEC89286.1 arsenate reductase [Tenacibaculum sp. MAR_2009_124]